MALASSFPFSNTVYFTGRSSAMKSAIGSSYILVKISAAHASRHFSQQHKKMSLSNISVDSLFSLNLVTMLSVSFLLFGFFTIASSKWTAVTKITKIPTSQLMSTSPQLLSTNVTSFKTLTSTVTCVKSSSVICPKRKRRGYIEPVRNAVESEGIDPSTIHWYLNVPLSNHTA